MIGFYLGGCLWFFCRKSIVLIYRELVNGCYCIKLLIFFMCILKLEIRSKIKIKYIYI